jgi:hypothetical protein
LRAAIERGVKFAAEFIHPDGSFGGEYTSRNTYNFFPHGFEIAGRGCPRHCAINDRFSTASRAASAPATRTTTSSATTLELPARVAALGQARPPVPPRPTGRVYFKNAGLLIDRRDGCELYLALNKGGVFKFGANGKLVASDTQSRAGQTGASSAPPSRTSWAKRREARRARNRIRGKLGWAKSQRMSTFNLVCCVPHVHVGAFPRTSSASCCNACSSREKGGAVPFSAS